MANGHGGARAGAGRKPGSINRLSIEFREKVEAACKAHNFDLIGEVVDIARNRQHEDQMQALRLLVDYAYPKLKAVEAQVETPTKVVLVDATKGPPELLEQLTNGHDHVDPLS